MRSIFIPAFIVAACVMVASQAASAHAFLDKSEPAVGSTVKVAPTQVKIWFTDDTQPDQSEIKVFDSKGNQVDKKDTHADPADKSILLVSLPTLRPGTYKVTWHALCPSSHKTQGDFQFTIGP
jgi:methionine-rich copper-binding protein CopC